MNKRFIATLAVLVVICQILAVRATPILPQQQTQPAPTGLALEVSYYKDRAPTYSPVPGADSKLNGAWYSSFSRVPSWQPPAGGLSVKAVNVISRLEGNTVRIEVSVYLGAKFFEKEQAIATYRIGENERVTVDELRHLGVEPFEIKVVRVSPLSPDLPAIVNKTQSVEVIGIRTNNSTFPSYTLTVQNLSAKKIAALGLNVLVNGKRQISSLRRRREGQVFLDSGATQEIQVPGAKTTQTTPAGYLPDTPPNQEILITTALFEDGSYEGDAETAAHVRGSELGSRIQVPRLIALLQEAANTTEPGVSAALERLKTQSAALGTTATPAALANLQNQFPSFDPERRESLKVSIEVALAAEKFDFIKKIEEFEKSNTPAASSQAFRAWLIASKERYEKWLAQLQSE